MKRMLLTVVILTLSLSAQAEEPQTIYRTVCKAGTYTTYSGHLASYSYGCRKVLVDNPRFKGERVDAAGIEKLKQENDARLAALKKKWREMGIPAEDIK